MLLQLSLLGSTVTLEKQIIYRLAQSIFVKIHAQLQVSAMLSPTEARDSFKKVHPCTGTEALYRPYGP